MNRTLQSQNTNKIETASHQGYNITFTTTSKIDGIESITTNATKDGMYAFNITERLTPNANTSISFNTAFDMDIVQDVLAEFTKIKAEAEPEQD